MEQKLTPRPECRTWEPLHFSRHGGACHVAEPNMGGDLSATHVHVCMYVRMYVIWTSTIIRRPPGDDKQTPKITGNLLKTDN